MANTNPVVHLTWWCGGRGFLPVQLHFLPPSEITKNTSGPVMTGWLEEKKDIYKLISGTCDMLFAFFLLSQNLWWVTVLCRTHPLRRWFVFHSTAMTTKGGTMWRFGVWNKSALCLARCRVCRTENANFLPPALPRLCCVTLFGPRRLVPSVVFTTHLFAHWFTLELTAAGEIPEVQSWIHAQRSAQLAASSNLSLMNKSDSLSFLPVMKKCSVTEPRRKNADGV